MIVYKSGLNLEQCTKELFYGVNKNADTLFRIVERQFGLRRNPFGRDSMLWNALIGQLKLCSLSDLYIQFSF